MMPPDADLKNHLANRRSLAEARASYFCAPCALPPASKNEVLDSPKMREEIAAGTQGR
jgi:hypothetical protein